MEICRISRPPLKTMFKHFVYGRDHVLKRLEMMGHKVQNLQIVPLRIPNPYLAYTSGMLFSLFKFRKIKSDIILADNIESGMAALLIKSVFKVRFVFVFVDDYSLIASYEGKALRYHALKYLERRIPKLADVIIAISPKVKKFCLDLDIPEQRLKMIPNGVDPGLFKPGIDTTTLRKELNLEGYKIVLFVGKINRYYNLEVILKAVPYALSKNPKTRFLLVGDGDDLHRLKALAESLKVDNSVVFAGLRPPEEIPKFVNLSDVCVFPLPYDSALAIFEYMSCAKPIVLPRGGIGKIGISQEVIREDCVLSVENSPKAFAEGIIFLMDNPEIGKEIGKKARERVVRLHDWDTLAKRYEKALKEVLH